MKKKILISEKQFRNLVNYISEDAVGYDDYNQMFHHGFKSVNMLMGILSDLVQVFKGIFNICNNTEISYIDLVENLRLAIDLIYEYLDASKTILQDFTDKKTITLGGILHRKLESYQDKIRSLINMGEELVNKDTLIQRLLDMTDSLLDSVTEYGETLNNAATTIQNRLDIGKPNMN